MVKTSQKQSRIRFFAFPIKLQAKILLFPLIKFINKKEESCWSFYMICQQVKIDSGKMQEKPKRTSWLNEKIMSEIQDF